MFINLIASVDGAYWYLSLCLIAFSINIRTQLHTALSLLIFIYSLVGFSLHTYLLELARSGEISIQTWYLTWATIEIIFLFSILYSYKRSYLTIHLRTILVISSGVFFILLQVCRMLDRTLETNYLSSFYTPAVLATVATKAVIISIPTLSHLGYKISIKMKVNKLSRAIKYLSLIGMFNRLIIKEKLEHGVSK